MDSENQHDDPMLYNSNRVYRNQNKVPLGTMEIPAHLNKASTSSVNVTNRKQLEARKRTLPNLERAAADAEAAHTLASDEYTNFVDLATQYRDAENARQPTAEQSRVIREINDSVITINLTGPGDGTPELGRKMAVQVLNLKKKKDAAMTRWNTAAKVFYYNFIIRDKKFYFSGA